MITGNEYLTCETLTSKPPSSVKESNTEASIKKGCARRRQVINPIHTALNPVYRDLN